MNLCKCGTCKQEVTKEGNNYLKGHHTRVKNPMDRPEVAKKSGDSRRGQKLGSPTENTKRKISKKLKGRKKGPMSNSQKKKIRKKLKGTKQSQETKRRKREKALGRKLTKEWIENISKSKLGDLNPAKRPKVIKKIRKTMIELWKDPNSVYHTEEYWKKCAKSQNIKPNKPETLILNILKKLYSGEWKYTGDYSFWINGKNPDFTCVNGKKLLIEHFGTWWHKGEDSEERKEIFSEFGYSTLVIWENELKNLEQVENKIKKFVGEN